MKTSLLSAGVLISFSLSSISLGYQITKNNKAASKFEKYQVPAHLTELEHKFQLADVVMIRDIFPFQKGIGLPWVFGTSEDGNHIIVRIIVTEKELPSDYNERKDAMETAAAGAVGAVLAQFGKGEVSLNDVVVEFISIENILHNTDKSYAIFSNGELTLH